MPGVSFCFGEKMGERFTGQIYCLFKCGQEGAMDIIVEMKGLHKRFGGVKAVDGVTLAISDPTWLSWRRTAWLSSAWER